MLVIGAEKGGDEAFDDIVTAFLYEMPLPDPRIYNTYLLFSRLPEEVNGPMMTLVMDEYREDEVFVHAYKVGYWDLYDTYEEFLTQTARLAAVGVVNGVDDMLTAIYGPLPQAVCCRRPEGMQSGSKIGLCPREVKFAMFPYQDGREKGEKGRA